MPENTESSFRALLPHLSEEEITTARERLRRYARLADEIHAGLPSPLTNDGSLTIFPSGGRVSSGQVDPKNFLHTG
jgi:hypothetical protein